MKTKLLSRLIFALAECVIFNLTGCAFKSVSRSKNIVYQEASNSKNLADQHLNIFSPKQSAELKEVFIFLHGGSWRSGKKSLYNFLGNRMARKNVVAVIIDYPLSPHAQYNDMATSSARALQWTKINIEQYGGDPDKIFVSGHSAGGHLAALIAVRNEYFDTLKITNPIKGVILIDAAGLDMYGYLQESKFENGHSYLKTFTSDPAQWKAASPLYHLHPKIPAMLIYRGEKTYPSILKSNEKFTKALKTNTTDFEYHVLKNKKHIPMITQFFWTWNPLYDQIIAFMKKK